ncbi:MAG TPA: hypothetical protein ENI34_02075 [candidate division WOR-3 bacterium]|uniref:O-antigen ligase domain-containing protein n=1 Tax=candidate division WOR-3 bacterium TaxID=2052148 RepID=A0A9C9EL56_UNCW3|nr:hypothetical protein [candidate division WOR-3 bacterium]
MSLWRLSEFFKRNYKGFLVACIIIYHFVIAGLFIHTFKILPYELFWITEAGILLLFIFSCIYCCRSYGLRRLLSFPKVYYLIMFFFLWGLVTSIVNSINLLTFLLQVKDYIRFVIFGFAVINLGLSKTEIKWLIFLILGIILLQVPISAVQCALWTLGDWCVGTLSAGATASMAFLCSIGTVLVIILYVFYKKRVFLLGLVPLFSLPIIFGNSQMGIFLYPYSFLFVLFYAPTQTFKPVLAAFLFTGLFITVLYFLLPPFQTTTKRYISLIGVAAQNQFVLSPDTTGRMRAPGAAIKRLVQKDNGFIFGYGFGATKKSYWKKLAGNFDNRKIAANQISALLIETGIPGLLFVSLFTIWLLVETGSLSFQFDGFSRVVTSTTFFASTLLILGSLYFKVYKSHYFIFLYWLFFGLSYSIKKNSIDFFTNSANI